MKDSKNSYEQKTWEYYAASHARGLRLLKKFGHVTLAKEIAERQIKQAEERYPCLKDDNPQYNHRFPH